MTCRARLRLAAASFVVTGVTGVTGVTAVAVVGLGVPAQARTRATLAEAPPQCMPPATEVVPEVPWAQTRLAPKSVWHLTQGEGVTVAVIDTGVDARVPQLRGRVLPGRDVINGGDRADRDCAGHGTFVAGIIAAAPRPGVGFVGIAPKVRVLPIRQTNDNRDGDVAGLVAAIREAVDAGASVVSVSTDTFQPSRALREVVAYAVARNVVIVVPANRAEEDSPQPDQEVLDRIVVVAGVGPNGAATSTGSDGTTGIHLVAPGANVLSLGPGGPGHLVGSGEGFAVPFVAGVAALVRAYHPSLTAAQVKRRLTLTADHPGGRLPDPFLGWGVVNPYAAVASVIPDEIGPRPPAPAPRTLTAPALSTEDVRGRNSALIVTGGAVGMAVVAALAAAIIGRGRSRRWQPASVKPDPRAS